MTSASTQSLAVNAAATSAEFRAAGWPGAGWRGAGQLDGTERSDVRRHGLPVGPGQQSRHHASFAAGGAAGLSHGSLSPPPGR